MQDRVDGELRSAAPPATQTLDVTNATAQMASALATESEAVTTTVIVAAAIDSTLAQVSESTSAARSSPEYHLAVIQPQPLVNTDVRDPNSGLPAVVVVKQGIEAQSGSETPIGAKKAAADESDWSEWE